MAPKLLIRQSWVEEGKAVCRVYEGKETNFEGSHTFFPSIFIHKDKTKTEVGIYSFAGD